MTANAGRLWDKGADLDALVHRFTVGGDPLLDVQLVHWDCLGSAAHARTLARAGFLTEEELAALLDGLRKIDALAAAGQFAITPELEDGHTAIEAWLTQHCGEAGRKIHAGRSRNDQVATAMRLWMRRRALEWVALLGGWCDALLARIERDGGLPMPGFTHGQPAMPSSVGQWLHAFVEAGLEQMAACFDLLARLDSCPLGTGAGFGVPLPLDREYAARLLGFSRAQRSAIDVQNSRGRLERYFVRVAADVAAMLEKFACDLLWLSGPGLGFFELPESLTTGSSLMPQKRNPDVLELLRARAGVVHGRLAELEWVAGKLPSSYHRDLQLTKGPTLRAASDVEELLAVGTRVVELFVCRSDRLATAMSDELYATAEALRRVQAGVPFRQAYQDVAAELRAGKLVVDRGAAAQRPEIVTPELLAALRGDVQKWAERGEQVQRTIAEAEASVL